MYGAASAECCLSGHRFPVASKSFGLARGLRRISCNKTKALRPRAQATTSVVMSVAPVDKQAAQGLYVAKRGSTDAFWELRYTQHFLSE